jgi:phage-related protein
MRLKGRSGISRALYVTAVGRRVVIVRVFVKKTEKTPRREIELALARVKSNDWEYSNGAHSRYAQEMDGGA